MPSHAMHAVVTAATSKAMKDAPVAKKLPTLIATGSGHIARNKLTILAKRAKIPGKVHQCNDAA